MNNNLNAHHRRLCQLVDDSLRRFTDLAPSSLHPEITKVLLVSLSQVHTRIRNWTVEFDADSCSNSLCASEHESPESSLIDHSNVVNSSHNGHRCMTSILGHLVPLFSLPNQYIKHLTSKTLVTIFECEIAYENGGLEFLDFMCLCLKMLIMKPWSVTVGNFPMEAPMSDLEASDSQLLQKLKLENANSSTTASIIGVLRNMLKLLQLNDYEEVLKVYLNSIAKSLSSWFMVIEACGIPNGNGSARFVDHGFIIKKTILQGNILQLFCSLVDASSSICAAAGSCEYCVIHNIRDIIPKLLAFYIDKPKNVGNARISEYLRHKILILMLRLSSTCHMENSVLVSWLHLIHVYFHDLLLQPIETPSDRNTYLEDSPFGIDILEEETRSISSPHLQRLAVFLFLRCSLTSLSIKENDDKYIEFSNWNIECPPGTKGLFELEKWLRTHLLAINASDPSYFNRCFGFASCLLQLYIHEDDLLFQMLLQTLCLPTSLRHRDAKVSIVAAKSDVFGLVSDIFNPINLFHLFLAKIFYDHQVILDYLISNDTGARCAEYLLKCLRVVCDEWDLFVEFPAFFESLHRPCKKRRKVVESDSDLGDYCSVSDIRDNSICTYLVVSFVDAKDCLLSLKASINSLHKKELFPYNPQVLLRRLSKIEEACMKQQGTYVSSKE